MNEADREKLVVSCACLFLFHTAEMRPPNRLPSVKEYQRHETARERALYQMAKALGWENLSIDGQLTLPQWNAAIQHISQMQKEGNLPNV
ncbi:hypothetical protein V2H45_05855 [Tumidithrix elongata RA019]|uniref:Uncharacterized protein n=1 Tax=Tumidithrix elongata BACA0141 TaxID=2716417 RepID=A0AAW9PZ10_9CYAN|nr:hypothetical protein [Tumidithrix elongata RA019]